MDLVALRLRLVTVVGLSTLALMAAVLSPASALAAGGGTFPTGGITTGPAPTLSAAQQAATQQKNARYASWLSQQPKSLSKIRPYCIPTPSGQCAALYWSTSTGAEYVTEPSDQPNWCAPGAATAVEMNWNYNAVIYYGNESNVPRDPGFGSGTESYTGGQGWMAWFAVHIGFWYGGVWRAGVMDYPYYSAGANQYVVATALNAVNGNNYYAVAMTTSTADMVGKVKYDTSVDNHPLDFFANAQYLPEWSVGHQLNHSIMVYAVNQVGGAPQYNADQVFYTDSASLSDGVTAGAYNTSANNMEYSLTTSAAGAKSPGSRGLMGSGLCLVTGPYVRSLPT